MAFHGKAGPLGLGYFQRFQVLPEPPPELVNELGAVIAVPGRQRNNAVVVNPHNFHLVQVHQGAQSLDGTGVAVVGGAGAQEIAGQRQPAALLVRVAVVARRPGINHDQVRIGNAPFPESGLEVGIGLDRGLALEELVEHYPGLHSRHVLPGRHFFLAETYHRLVGGLGFVVQDYQEGFPPDGISGVEAADHLLRRFF